MIHFYYSINIKSYLIIYLLIIYIIPKQFFVEPITLPRYTIENKYTYIYIIIGKVLHKKNVYV